MSPVEDVVLDVLRSKITTVNVQTKIETGQTFPFILMRSQGSWGDWTGDPRFLDAAVITISCLCQGLNSDEDAALLAEAVRVVLRDSKNHQVPGRGYLVSASLMDRPKRSPDWAASSGPVQYADLPTDVERWEATYKVVIRKPMAKPFA